MKNECKKTIEKLNKEYTTDPKGVLSKLHSKTPKKVLVAYIKKHRSDNHLSVMQDKHIYSWINKGVKHEK